MVDVALQARILSMLRDGRAALIEAAPDRPTSPAPQWRAGQTLEARVETKLADGRSLIDVEGTLFQVRLPERQDTQVGQRMQLTVIRPGPAPTLMLGTPAAEALGNTSSRVSLSTLASQVATMLSAGTTSTDNAPARGAAPTPLLPILSAPPATGAALAAPLRQALETSGLFYESHQAEWVGGKRELEALRQEPQARIAREEQGKGAPDKTDGARPMGRQDDEAVTATRSTPVPALRSDSGTAAAPTAPLPPAVAGIVDRQLDAIANQQIVWQGQVWPGQAMDWRVEEQAARPGEEEGGARWRTELRLQLPVLGAMTARLDLNGEHLAIAIDASGGPVSLTTMRAGESDLRAMLEARGLALDTFRVTDDAGT